MKKAKYIVIIVLFLALTALPYPIWMTVKPYFETEENTENREMAELPSLSDISAFPEAFEDYVNDSLPFRTQIIKTAKEVEYNTLSLTSTTEVLVGQDEWLFYIDPEDGDSIRSYEGQDALTDEQLEQIKSNVVESKKNLEEEGCTFVILIVPNKERVYSEYMPEEYGEPAEVYAAQQIYDYLKANTDVKVVYPLEALQEAKSELGEETLLYYKADSHWNHLGAYIASREVLKEVGRETGLPDISEITIESKTAENYDLAKMLNVADQMDVGLEYVPTGYEENNLFIGAENFQGVSEYVTNLDTGRLYMRHDSFGEYMTHYMASQFSSATFHHRIDDLNEDHLRATDPDTFVFEISERYVVDALTGWYYAN